METNFGPAGDYLWSCRKCRMKADDMICECRGKFKEVHTMVNETKETAATYWGKLGAGEEC